MRIAHTAKVMFFRVSVLLFTGGGWSGKVHYEHILATSARYAIDIRIAFLFTFDFIVLFYMV